MPTWAVYLSSIGIVILAAGLFYALTSGTYGDWVRDFYAKRDRLQTLFEDDKKKK
jgi:hypothetical protein